MLLVQLTGGWPAQLLTHVRYVLKFASARDSAQRKIQNFLEALYVFLRAVTKDGETVSDVREDQSIDQSRQKVGRDLMTHVGQPDENTVAFFDESRHVRVPGEVLVEHDAKVPHRGALTDHVLAEPNGDGV